MDFASPLTVRANWRGMAHRNPPLPASAAQSFLAQIVASKPVKNTELERQRAKAFSALGQATSATKINEAFKRLILQDNVTKENVTDCLHNHLRDLGVSNDRVKGALLQMLQRVRDSKGSGKDVVPALKDVLNAEVVPTVRPSDYVQRGAEQGWIAELSAQRALLLSGPPRCGKTDAAKWVAGALQELGFEVLRFSLVDEAERVLLDRRSNEVLVVLDDPLGSDLEVNSKAGQALRSLERLIRELAPNRRLIVAQSQEVLLAARSTDSLDKVKTGNLPWYNLGQYPSGFLLQVWDVQSKRNKVPDDVKTAVTSAIAAGELDVPAGVLAHVAAYHQNLQGTDVVRQAQSLASESTIDFAMTLCSSGAKEVVRALAIGSTAIETSADRELAFILGEGVELEMPKSDGILVFPPDNQFGDPITPPSYAKEPNFPRSARNILVNLEMHRVLRRKQADHFEFSHPYYRAAARAVVRQVVSMEKDDVLSAIRRGLFSPSPSTSAATARNLWWLHRDLTESINLGDSIVELAGIGLNWYFPTTRDLCYEFLIEVVKAEPEKYLKKLQYWVNSMSRIEIEDVVWDCGDPFFPAGREHSTLSFLRTPPVPNEAHVRQTVVKLRAGDALPNPGSAVEALRFFKAQPNQLESDVLLRLLGFSEGLIRAEAAYIWLLVERTNDDEILERLRRETHPSVVSRILNAVTKAWNAVSSDRKTKLGKVFKTHGPSQRDCAICTI
ncbi:hypothetical protein [Malikia spinosa]|uniref:Novel STAND NTPase 3 domain-containing protein n=1 Tax=Malikia spinosa TaxID=86180 RepID=A0A7C9IZP8_9BURK|nr:hypothetical protein [Malikia spinosa]MYZ54193.1 hypothetical protein [Malikia spinosa]